MSGSVQGSLDFASLEPRLNPTAPEEMEDSLQVACWNCLALLLHGPATKEDLKAVAGDRFGSRLGELRPFLAKAAGRGPYIPEVHKLDVERNPIPKPTRGEKPSNPVYRLAPWVVDAGRELLARHVSTNPIATEAA